MLISPGAGDPGDSGGHLEGPAAVPLWEHRAFRDGAAVIARGSLICPGCELPVALAKPLPAGSAFECGFCGHTARAWTLVRPGIADTDANVVALVARFRA